MQKAVVIDAQGRVALESATVPVPSSTEVLVKVECAGQIPCDCLCFSPTSSRARLTDMALMFDEQGRWQYTPNETAPLQAAISPARSSALAPTSAQAFGQSESASLASSTAVCVSAPVFFTSSHAYPDRDPPDQRV